MNPLERGAPRSCAPRHRLQRGAAARTFSLLALSLIAATAGAQELLVLPGAPPDTQVLSVPAMDSPAVQPLGVSPRSLVPRVALPTRDGTDLIILGCQGGFGDPACASTGAASVTRLGRETIGFTEILGGSLPTPSSVVTRLSADWVGTSNRHLAVLTPLQTGTGIETQLRFYDSAAFDPNGQLALAVPTGWSVPSATVNLPAGFNAQGLVALSPTQLLLSDGTASLRLLSAAGTFSTCAIDGGNAALTVKALLPLGNGGAIAALRQSNEDGTIAGRVAVIPPGCSGGASTAGHDPGQPFADILALAQDGARVFGSGVDPLTGATFLVTWNLPGGGTTLSGQQLEVFPAPADPSAVGEPYGALAVVQSGGVPYLVVAGAGGGFRVRKFVGSAFPLVTPTLPGGVSAGPASAAVVNPPARFTLSSRLIDLNPGLATTNGYLEIFNGNGKAFTIHPGSCRRTDVADAIETANGITIRGGQGCMSSADCPLTQSCTGQTCRLPLSSRAGTPGSFSVPAAGPSGGRTLLAFQQIGGGESCELVIACDPTSGACGADSGGGAIVKVQGGARSLALVLDRSGSMTLPVAPGDPTTRQQALVDALTVFRDVVATVVAGVGDNQRYVVAPFDHRSLGSALPMGAPSWSGAEFIDPTNQGAILAQLSPSGATNIRGALRTAADRLVAIPSAGGAPVSRSVLLMTDGLHNTRGVASENDNATTFDPVGGLLNIVPDLRASAADGRARVNRLYAVGLSPASYHPALLDLVRQVNSSVSSGALPPGYLSYADGLGGVSGTTQLTQFFTKVLWDYLGATEYVDPVFTLQPGAARTVDVDMRAAQNLVLLVAWRGAAPPMLSLGVDGKVQAVLLRNCRQQMRSLVCVFTSNVLSSGRTLNVTAQRSAQGADPGEILIEAAGASRVRMLPLQTRAVARTGEALPFLVRVTEDGLPLRKSPSLAARLVRPKAALGTVLATAAVGADAIKRQLGQNPDHTPASAKLSLLKATDLPGYEEVRLVLNDDGKSGDGAAGDGVFGVKVTAELPGLYQLIVSGDVAGSVGAVRRETSLATQVVVAVSGARSILKKVYTAGTREKPGTLELELRPQDARGNLLGPGTGEIFRFRQGGRPLQTTVTEPDSYDGSYRLTVSGIVSPGAAVTMEGVGLSDALVLVPEYRPPAPQCQGGCCCDVRGGRHASPLAAGAVAGLLALALLLRRRRLGA